MDCIFCKIVAKEVPSEFLAEDASSIVIRDRNPVCKTHVLVIAKEHKNDIHQASFSMVLNRCMDMAVEYAEEHLPNGFRLVINTGDDGGQTVKHFHIHLLGGEKLPVGGL